MRRFVGAIAATLVLTLSATSATADGHVGRFAGLYAGIHGGKAWGDVEGGASVLTVPTVGTFTANTFETIDIDGGIFGGHVGYNHQSGNVVMGIEVSYTGGSIDGNFTGNIQTSFLSDESLDAEVSSVFQAVFRLGYALDKALIYGKIGYASADLEFRSVDTIGNCLGCIMRGDERRGGLVLGGGLDYEIFSNVMLGVDYSYINFKSENSQLSFFNPANGFTGTATLGDIDPNIHAVTARLSYKFGGRRHTAHESLK